MDYNDYTHKELDHLRLLDLSMLAVSATLLYLVAANWNPAPELEKELDTLREIKTKLDNQSLTASELEQVTANGITDMMQRKAELSNVVSVINEKKQEIWMQNHINDSYIYGLARISSRPNTITGNLLMDSRNYFTSDEWEIEKAEGIDQGFKWSQECQIAINGYIEDLHKFKAASNFMVDNDGSIVIILNNIAVDKWPSIKAGIGHAKINATITLYERIFSFEKPIRYEYNKQCIADVTFTSRRTRIKPNLESWFSSKFIHIGSRWEDLKGLNIGYAKIWATRLRASGIAEQKPSILGLSLGGKGEYVFGLGLLVLLSIHCYMLIYLSRLKHYVQNNSYTKFITPWVGTMNTTLALLILITTTSLMPLAASFFSLWRILGLRWYLAFAASLTLNSLGAWNTFLARRITRHVSLT